MSRLLVPQGTAVPGTEAKSSVAQVVKTHDMETDDFLGPPSVQKQLDELAAYVKMRQEINPAFHLPEPFGWRMSVLMLTFPKVTDGGLQLVDETLDARALTTPQGVILSLGEGCYTDPDRFLVDGNMQKWAKPGDRITWKKYDVATFTLANKQILGFVTDSQPIARIDEGWSVPQ